MLWRDCNHADFQMFERSILKHHRAEHTGDFSRFRGRKTHTHAHTNTSCFIQPDYNSLQLSGYFKKGDRREKKLKESKQIAFACVLRYAVWMSCLKTKNKKHHKESVFNIPTLTYCPPLFRSSAITVSDPTPLTSTTLFIENESEIRESSTPHPQPLNSTHITQSRPHTETETHTLFCGSGLAHLRLLPQGSGGRLVILL